MTAHLMMGFVWEERLKALTKSGARILAIKKFKGFLIVYFKMLR
jgi:hypothetical protein